MGLERTNIIQGSSYIADAYYRLSKEDGDKPESNSIGNQKALVREFLKTHPDISIYGEKIDDGYTGVHFQRPGFQSMLEDIKLGIVNCVIVKDLSRFGRNYIEAGRYIEKIFPYLGVRFIAINDHIDTASEKRDIEELFIPFKNLMNDAYCRDISIKVRSHLDIKRKDGQYIGSFAPYGYKKSSENKNQLVIDQKAALIVRQIFEWKKKGMSSLRIAEKLNELGVLTPMEYKHSNGEHFQCGFRRKVIPRWEANGVNRILKNEIYTGVLLQGKTYSLNYKIRKRIRKEEQEWIRCENSHEAIIPKEEFQIVQDLFKSDTRIAPGQQRLYLFSGFVKCGYCGENMIRKTIPSAGKKYVYLVCTENKNQMTCKNQKEISSKRLENVIFQVINFYMNTIFDYHPIMGCEKNISLHGEFLKKLQGYMMDKMLEIEKKRHYLSYIDQDFQKNILSKEEWAELKECYWKKLMDLKKEMQVLEMECEQIQEHRKKQQNTVWNFEKSDGFQVLTREVLLKLIEKICVYDKNRIEIIFSFRSVYE